MVKNLQFCLVGKGHPQQLNNILRVVYVDVPQFLFGYKGNCATRASESAPALEDGRIESFEDHQKIRFIREISELIDVEYVDSILKCSHGFMLQNVVQQYFSLLLSSRIFQYLKYIHGRICL